MTHANRMMHSGQSQQPHQIIPECFGSLSARDTLGNTHLFAPGFQLEVNIFRHLRFQFPKFRDL
ncbi:MAG: hypothetical protein CL581_06105 [Alteromonadaceae bacterium]|nr:hypothetical protein [Alteromonadaceae bacterium]MBH84361.1 hypothetical protein [Alteromonadaceae bacterium]